MKPIHIPNIMMMMMACLLIISIPFVAAGRYTGAFSAVSTKSSASIKPFLSPDNSESEQLKLIDSARKSVDVEIQYARAFDKDMSFKNHPLLQALVNARKRGATVRVILEGRKGADKDDIAGFLRRNRVLVRFMDGLKWNHNKAIIVDGQKVALSSVNWSFKSLHKNREAGLIVDNKAIVGYFMDVFNHDWNNGDVNVGDLDVVSDENNDYASMEMEDDELYLVQDEDEDVADAAYEKMSSRDFPTFRGSRQMTAFVNPDSSKDLILNYIRQAKKSLYLEIYSISNADLVDAVIDLKKKVPGIDIKILISYNRASYPENVNTVESAERMWEAGIDVWKTTNKLYFTHAKFWCIDGEHLFLYSGNWAGSSVSEPNAPASANREFGLLVSDKEVTQWFTEKVFNRDLALGNLFGERNALGSIMGLQSGDIVQGTTRIYAQTHGAKSAYLMIGLNGDSEEDPQYHKIKMRRKRGSRDIFGATVNTADYCLGMKEIMVEVEPDDKNKKMSHSKAVFVNFVKSTSPADFRVVINEVMFRGNRDPADEYVQFVNANPFDIVIGGWRFGKAGKQYEIPAGTVLRTRKYFTLVQSKNQFYEINDFRKSLRVFESSLGLRNTEDTVLLTRTNGDLQDSVSWDTTAKSSMGNKFVGPVEPMNSLQRRPFGINTFNNAQDFQAMGPHPGFVYPYIPRARAECQDLHHSATGGPSSAEPVSLPTQDPIPPRDQTPPARDDDEPEIIRFASEEPQPRKKSSFWSALRRFFQSDRVFDSEWDEINE